MPGLTGVLLSVLTNGTISDRSLIQDNRTNFSQLKVFRFQSEQDANIAPGN